MNLIIDEGNTRIKLAVYHDKQFVDIEYANKNNYNDVIKVFIKKHAITSAILSSVTDEINIFFNELSIEDKVVLSYTTPLPFYNNYKSPKTLGVDRIALIAAAWNMYPNKNSLVIDAGTCITYDFINDLGSYEGGAIAPGLNMRFDSMYAFTKKLPKIEVPLNSVPLIGATTQQCLESGVVNGTMFELEGTIRRYEQEYGNVNVILTGGDAKFLYKQLKNSIFANSYFLLEGLNVILMYQTK